MHIAVGMWELSDCLNRIARQITSGTIGKCFDSVATTSLLQYQLIVAGGSSLLYILNDASSMHFVDMMKIPQLRNRFRTGQLIYLLFVFR